MEWTRAAHFLEADPVCCKRIRSVARSGCSSLRLFLSEEHLHRAAEEVELRAELVLQEAAVRLADILRQVAEEGK